MIRRLLVANRGEIARRVVRTCRALGVSPVAVHSGPDAGGAWVAEADAAVALPGVRPYLSAELLVDAALRAGADAVHPGYGFLAEDAGFARAVLAAGLVWVGPPPEAIAAMGSKVAAKERVAAAGVPVLDSWDPGSVPADARYPLLVKASFGGGGRGMRVVRSAAGLPDAVAAATREAEAAFGDGTVFVERWLEGARHIEVQVLADTHGTVLALGERDCSVQRRHQKVAEESPSPGVSAALRAEMLAAAVRAAEAVDYRGAGTVECLVPADAGDTEEFFFLEMNTRLQVEHPVTELVTGVDLVEEQLRVAAGEPPALDPDALPAPRGHAIELRVYAEDPKRFLPGPGKITRWEEPSGEGIRVDSGYAAGDTVTPYYDPLMAKLCVWAPDRPAALERAREAVAGFAVEGPKCNLPFFAELLASPDFVSGRYDTGLIGRMRG